jgi:hypothetical protein
MAVVAEDVELSFAVVACKKNTTVEKRNKKSPLMMISLLVSHQRSPLTDVGTQLPRKNSHLLCIVFAVVFVVMACRCRLATQVRTSMVGDERLAEMVHFSP